MTIGYRRPYGGSVVSFGDLVVRVDELTARVGEAALRPSVADAHPGPHRPARPQRFHPAIVPTPADTRRRRCPDALRGPADEGYWGGTDTARRGRAEGGNP